MFEDSLMESGGLIKTKSKYWSILTLILNGAILAGLAIWPLLHTLALPNEMMATLLVAPAPPPPPPPPPPPAVKVVQVKSEILNNELQAPSKIPKVIKQVTESAPPSMGVAGMGEMGGSAGGAMGAILGGTGTGPVVKQAPPTKLKISSGVMVGNLLVKTQPRYPEIARQARISGTVVLQATISKTGTITNLKVISGPPMLQQAALDAVSTWRYRPYELNGDAVEVETTVNVVFNLGD